MNINQAPDESLPTFIVRPSRGWRFLDMREIWSYRELLYFLAWRDVKVRYKQTAIGIAWAVLQPAALTTTFTLFFGYLAKIPSDGIPYPVFAFAGLLPWLLFSRNLSESTNSLVTDQRLITRVYFPRILVPTATTMAALIDLAIGGVLLVALMAWYGLVPSWHIVFLPAFLALMLLTVLGCSFWLSALNVEYRDVMYLVPFLNQFWLFITPVVYPASLVPERWQVLYALNPMAGVIEGFRWSILGIGKPPSMLIAVSSVITLTVFLTGIVWFRYRERTFIDAIGSGGR